MFKAPIAPYLTPDSSVVAATNWKILENGEWEDLPDYLPSWSQGTDLSLERTLRVDLDRLYFQTQIPMRCPVAICVTWVSESSKIKRRLLRRELESETQTISVRLPGDEIGGRVRIETTLIVGANSEASEPWIAHEVGSILLSDRSAVTLEGDGTAFSMAVVDFAESIYPTQSSWFLRASSEVSDRFSSTFQILINERDKKLVRAVERTTRTREDQAIIDEMMHGVMAQLLQIAYTLRSQGRLDLTGNEEGSVGDVLAGIVEQTGAADFEPTDDPSELPRQRAFFESLARSLGAGRSFR